MPFLVLSSRQRCAITLLVSLALHAIVIVDLLRPSLQHNANASKRSGAASTKARLQVFTVTVSPPRRKPDRETVPIASPRHSANEAAPKRANVSAAESAPTPPTAAPSGSPIMSAFAPLLSGSIGTANWGGAAQRAGPPPMPPMPPMPSMPSMQQQIRAQYQAALMERLGTWLAQQAQRQSTGDCLLRIGLDSHRASVSCTSRGTESELWAALSGLAVAGNGEGEALTCLRAGNGQLGFVGCNDEADDSRQTPIAE